MKPHIHIAVIVSTIDEEYQSGILSGIRQFAFANGVTLEHFVASANTGGDAGHDTGEYNIFSLADFQRFDGVILVINTIQNPVYMEAVLERARQTNVPVVCLDKDVPELYTIRIDNEKSMQDIVEHFILHHGFTRINYVSGPADNIDSRQRLKAYRDVLEKLERHKVNIRYARRVPGSMGTWLAVFDNTGDVIASISKRPDPSVIADILREQGDEIFSEADAIAVEVDIDDGIMKQILSLAEKHGKQVYALVSNMSIALERRDLLRRVDCFVCNAQEAGQFFSEEYAHLTPDQLALRLADRVRAGDLRRMVITLGSQGAVYADADGSVGVIPSLKVDVIDTTGCGDAFFAGVCIGLTYGRTLREACQIGTRLAGAVIATRENVCPRFLPAEFGLPEPKERD